eukprot:scaffold238873_cov37-Tisochrysis_lutea.AAC.1
MRGSGNVKPRGRKVEVDLRSKDQKGTNKKGGMRVGHVTRCVSRLFPNSPQMHVGDTSALPFVGGELTLTCVYAWKKAATWRTRLAIDGCMTSRPSRIATCSMSSGTGSPRFVRSCARKPDPGFCSTAVPWFLWKRTGHCRIIHSTSDGEKRERVQLVPGRDNLGHASQCCAKNSEQLISPPQSCLATSHAWLTSSSTGLGAAIREERVDPSGAAAGGEPNCCFHTVAAAAMASAARDARSPIHSFAAGGRAGRLGGARRDEDFFAIKRARTSREGIRGY